MALTYTILSSNATFYIDLLYRTRWGAPVHEIKLFNMEMVDLKLHSICM